MSVSKLLSQAGGYDFARGEATFVTAGTYNFTLPSYVTSVCVVCVGGGQGGGQYGGQGGALVWTNDLTVTGGETLNIRVGTGGLAAGDAGSTTAGGFGQSSYVKRGVTTLVEAEGGKSNATQSHTWTGATGAGYQGGHGSIYTTGSSPYGSVRSGGGGGGAAGYAGNGGAGGITQGNDGTGGSGGGGSWANNGVNYSSSSDSYFGDQGGAGGGVGIYGQGANGLKGVNAAISSFDWAATGGSGGLPATNNTSDDGGEYGGGAGGYASFRNSSGTTTAYVSIGDGADGAVRIIWGRDRAFPSTDVDASSSVEVYVDGVLQ